VVDFVGLNEGWRYRHSETNLERSVGVHIAGGLLSFSLKTLSNISVMLVNYYWRNLHSQTVWQYHSSIFTLQSAWSLRFPLPLYPVNCTVGVALKAVS